MNYSPELKEALLRRMLPPNNESISKISKEEYLNRLSVTGVIRPEPTVLQHLERLLFFMTGAHRINFLSLLKQQA